MCAMNSSSTVVAFVVWRYFNKLDLGVGDKSVPCLSSCGETIGSVARNRRNCSASATSFVFAHCFHTCNPFAPLPNGLPCSFVIRDVVINRSQICLFG